MPLLQVLPLASLALGEPAFKSRPRGTLKHPSGELEEVRLPLRVEVTVGGGGAQELEAFREAAEDLQGANPTLPVAYELFSPQPRALLPLCALLQELGLPVAGVTLPLAAAPEPLGVGEHSLSPTLPLASALSLLTERAPLTVTVERLLGLSAGLPQLLEECFPLPLRPPVTVGGAVEAGEGAAESLRELLAVAALGVPAQAVFEELPTSALPGLVPLYRASGVEGEAVVGTWRGALVRVHSAGYSATTRLSWSF